MPKKKPNASTPFKFYRKIGMRGWRASGYMTLSSDSPALRAWIAAKLPATGKDVLSIGCGGGELENHLAEFHHQLVGLDLSLAMLQRAARKGLDLAVQADAQSLPFGSACFDRVLFIELIGHLALDKACQEAWRVLRKRGKVLITTYAPHMDVHPRYKKFSLDELAAGLVTAGFRVDEQSLLVAKRKAVTEAPSADRATLLYIEGTKRA